MGIPPFGSRLLPRAFNAGAYIHGPHSGLHGTTMEYEIPVLLLTSVVRGTRPNLKFSTVSLLRNMRAALHRDRHNHAATTNLVLPLTQFTGGEVFVEDSSGTSIQGNPPIAGTVFPLLCDQEPTPVEFNPRLLHCTLPWGGERVILVAFHIRNPDMLPSQAAEQLIKMGVSLQKK